MTKALVRWTDPRVISVHLPPARPCTAQGCGRPAMAYLVWLSREESGLFTEEVCRPHHDLGKRLGGCLLSPLSGPQPNLDLIAHAVQQHLSTARRSDVYGRRHYQTVTFGFGGFASTGTATGGYGGWGFR